MVKIRKIIKTVRKDKAFTDFDVAWVLMNLIDYEVYDLAKYHFEKMRDMTLAYVIEKLKAVKMKFKNMNSATTGAESAHKGKKISE